MEVEKLAIPVEKQKEFLKKGAQYLKLTKAAKIGEGIMSIDQSEIDRLANEFDSYEGSITKFVPASGAASRMFKHVYDLNAGGYLADEFIKKINQLPFINELELVTKNLFGSSVEELIDKKRFADISDAILSDQGLGYGNLPKGLIPFHKYEDQVRTAFEEQISEGIAFSKENLEFHFTVSSELENEIASHISNFMTFIGEEFNVQFSNQAKYTDTICLDENDEIVLNEYGSYFTRPGGHGALIHNLDKIDTDIIFLKNIDNVSLANTIEEQVLWKKVLAGKLLETQNKIFSYISDLENMSVQTEEVIAFFKSCFHKDLSGYSREDLIAELDKPLRVCGMVKNEGQPGGGPFFIDHEECDSLQIVESAEIDKSDVSQLQILNQASHFNPVDIVCGVKNRNGVKFNLHAYVNPDAYFISEKNVNGKPIKVLELPGLWNGSMSNWNTIFIEVPAFTFNPVKTVNDLLKKSHQAID